MVDLPRMFGRKPQFGQDAPYTTPGIGDGIPGNMRIDGRINLPPEQGGQGVDTSVPTDPYAGQRPDIGGPAPSSEATGSPPQMPQMSDAGLRPSVLADQPMQIAPMDTSQLIQDVKPQGSRFFAKDGAWRYLAGGVLDGLATHFGGQPGFAPAMQRAEQDRREQAQWLARRKVERDEKLADRTYDENKPQYFSGSEDRVKLDPLTGKSTKVYDAPSSAEAYAGGLGYAPGSDQYRQAMQDYTLRSWSGTALNNRMAFDDYRTDNRSEVKGSPTYRDLHPRPLAPRQTRLPTTQNVIAGVLGKVGKGQQLTPGEAQIFATWKNGRGRGGGKGGGADPLEGKTIVNSSTGQRMIRKDGQWVPA